MPKDPKRNLQRYQIRGGHLNEFEFQKSQRELARDSDFPFGDQKTGQPGLNQAEPVAAVTEDTGRKVEKRTKRAASMVGSDLSIASPGKGPPKKGTRKSAQKTATPSRTKNREKVPVEAKQSSKKLARSPKKTTKQASTKRK